MRITFALVCLSTGLSINDSMSKSNLVGAVKIIPSQQSDHLSQTDSLIQSESAGIMETLMDTIMPSQNYYALRDPYYSSPH